MDMLNLEMQLGFEFRKVGGKRTGAGRPRVRDEVFMRHERRPEHRRWAPVHVTMRTTKLRASLREEFLFRGLRRIFARASRGDFRLVHFSVQRDHLHLIVEAADKRALAKGMQWLSSIVARAVNATCGRRGKLWRERYHRHDLKTPREVRNALVYVLFNFRKHAPSDVREPGRCLDPKSSALWFDGWETRAGPWLAALMQNTQEPIPVVAPHTMLLTKLWRKGGLITLRERPRA